jgi:YggT family protein
MLNLLGRLLALYQLIIFGRLILDYVRMFSRDWRPRGPMLLLAEFLYTVTDPPLRLLRRALPPLRLGTVALDLSYLVLFLAVSLLQRVVLSAGA